MSDTAVAEAPATTTTGNGPAFKINLGNISIAMFSGEKSTADGKIFLAQDIVIEKSWKKKDGNYDSRKLTVDPEDTLKIIAGLQQTYLAAANERYTQ